MLNWTKVNLSLGSHINAETFRRFIRKKSLKREVRDGHRGSNGSIPRLHLGRLPAVSSPRSKWRSAWKSQPRWPPSSRMGLRLKSVLTLIPPARRTGQGWARLPLGPSWARPPGELISLLAEQGRSESGSQQLPVSLWQKPICTGEWGQQQRKNTRRSGFW